MPRGAKQDELPWQVVGVMDGGRMEDFVKRKRQWDDTARRAEAGEGLSRSVHIGIADGFVSALNLPI